MFIIKNNNEFHAMLKEVCDGKHSSFPTIRQLELSLGMASGTISRYKFSSPGLLNVIKIANATNMDLCFCAKSEIDVLSNLDSSVDFIEASDEENTIYTRSILSLLNTFFESDNVSLSQKNDLEEKIKDLLLQQMQEIL